MINYSLIIPYESNNSIFKKNATVSHRNYARDEIQCHNIIRKDPLEAASDSCHYLRPPRPPYIHNGGDIYSPQIAFGTHSDSCMAQTMGLTKETLGNI